MNEQRFDDLARLVAQRQSRRQMLKILVGGAAGSLLGSRLSPALAAGGGNSVYAQYCNQIFGAGTADQSQCASDAAHQRGLAYSACGPNGSGGTICGGPSYSSTKCCSGTTSACSNGTCVAPCSSHCAGCNATCSGDVCNCPAGTVAITTANGTTTCAKTCDPAGYGLGCGSLVCITDVNGHGYCTDAGGPGVNCSRDADCPAGTYCSTYGNAGGSLCANATC